MRNKSRAPKREVATNIQKITMEDIKISLDQVVEVVETFDHEIVVKCPSKNMIIDRLQDEFELNDTLFRMLVDIITLHDSFVVRLKRR